MEPPGPPLSHPDWVRLGELLFPLVGLPQGQEEEDVEEDIGVLIQLLLLLQQEEKMKKQREQAITGTSQVQPGLHSRSGVHACLL
jgi:hypothetical protein